MAEKHTVNLGDYPFGGRIGRCERPKQSTVPHAVLLGLCRSAIWVQYHVAALGFSMLYLSWVALIRRARGRVAAESETGTDSPTTRADGLPLCDGDCFRPGRLGHGKAVVGYS